MRRFSAGILVALLCAAALQSQNNKPIGTFDKRAIVVAFYRSPLWAATLEHKRKALGEAKAKGDMKLVQQLENWGSNAQELAHQQLKGQAGIANIEEALAPAFLEIEKTAGVSKVVPAQPGTPVAGTIDVTNKLLDWLKADEATREMIRNLPPLG